MVVCKPFTMGYFVPSSPTSGDIHIYDVDASSLSNHRNNGDTADVTTASVGDHFKYDGTNWVLEISTSDGAVFGELEEVAAAPCVDLEDNESVYQQYKKAGYYDQIECQHCHKTVDRYLHLAHESLCK